MHQDAELREAFNAFDADRSGSITQDELKKAMKNCGNNCSDKEIEDMIKKADKDGDGKVSFAGKKYFFTFLTIGGHFKPLVSKTKKNL